MIPTTHTFKKDLPRHLHNTTMRENIARATRHSMAKRSDAVAEIPEWEELREQAHRIKQEIIDHLDDYLERFEQHAHRHGIEVLRAKDARMANQLAEKIARQNGVKTIIKSKSMLTEEIGFNRHMIQQGYEVVETDLGEYIIQLAGEAPSHITGPAVHKSRAEIARLFHDKLGLPYSDDPAHLTETARQVLREKFLTADMGVTGANFGIAENGGIVIVENEGNARLCSTLPRTHIAFVGMERLIPSVADLPLFLTLLCRSSTGQRLTSFISMINGPRSDTGYDGPEKVYYIVVDNGRSKFLKDPRLKEALYCIRCGACYNTCPVYQNIGGHAYGWVYQGPIGAVIAPEFLGLAAAKELPFASSLCGSCSDVCPVKIPLHHLLLYQRNRIVNANLVSGAEKLIFKVYLQLTRSERNFARIGYWSKKITRPLINHLRIPGWSISRALPGLPKGSFREWWNLQSRKPE